MVKYAKTAINMGDLLFSPKATCSIIILLFAAAITTIVTAPAVLSTRTYLIRYFEILLLKYINKLKYEKI